MGKPLLATPLKPAMAVAAQTMEMIAPHGRAVAIEVDADLVSGTAPQTAALIREGRERGDVHGLHSSAHYRLRRCRRNHPTNK